MAIWALIALFPWAMDALFPFYTFLDHGAVAGVLIFSLCMVFLCALLFLDKARVPIILRSFQFIFLSIHTVVFVYFHIITIAKLAKANGYSESHNLSAVFGAGSIWLIVMCLLDALPPYFMRSHYFLSNTALLFATLFVLNTSTRHLPNDQLVCLPVACVSSSLLSFSAAATVMVFLFKSIVFQLLSSRGSSFSRLFLLTMAVRYRAVTRRLPRVDRRDSGSIIHTPVLQIEVEPVLKGVIGKYVR
jgi:hypothetical protein